MLKLKRTQAYIDWINGLTDERAVARITVRVDRLGMGNAGDAESVGDGISELRIHYGPGYRVYYKKSGSQIIVLLCGGDKSTQKKDIKEAKDISKNL